MGITDPPSRYEETRVNAFWTAYLGTYLGTCKYSGREGRLARENTLSSRLVTLAIRKTTFATMNLTLIEAFSFLAPPYSRSSSASNFWSALN